MTENGTELSSGFAPTVSTEASSPPLPSLTSSYSSSWEQERSRLLSQFEALPVWNRNRPLCFEGLRVLERWHRDLDVRTWRGIEKRVAKELNEAEPCLRYASEWVLSSTSSSFDGGAAGEGEGGGCVPLFPPPQKKATILDLCSGFGIMSMLLSEILPPDRVEKIWLLDKMWPCVGAPSPSRNDDEILGGEEGVKGRGLASDKASVDHILGRDWPIPLRLRKVNIKAGREMRQVRTYVLDTAPGPVLLLGVHLCKALSVHAVKLFHHRSSSSDKITAMILKPCCLPGKNMMFRRRNPIVWKFENGYEFRPQDVYGIDEGRRSVADDDEDQVFDDGEDNDMKESQVHGGECSRRGGIGQEKEKKPVAATALTVAEVDDRPSVGDNDDDYKMEQHDDGSHGGGVRHGFGGMRRHQTNQRFTRWVEHLSRACEDDRCRVCVKHIDITKHHFQNQFIFCEKVAATG